MQQLSFKRHQKKKFICVNCAYVLGEFSIDRNGAWEGEYTASEHAYKDICPKCKMDYRGLIQKPELGEANGRVGYSFGFDGCFTVTAKDAYEERMLMEELKAKNKAI